MTSFTRMPWFLITLTLFFTLISIGCVRTSQDQEIEGIVEEIGVRIDTSRPAGDHVYVRLLVRDDDGNQHDFAVPHLQAQELGLAAKVFGNLYEADMKGSRVRVQTKGEVITAIKTLPETLLNP